MFLLCGMWCNAIHKPISPFIAFVWLSFLPFSVSPLAVALKVFAFIKDSFSRALKELAQWYHCASFSDILDSKTAFSFTFLLFLSLLFFPIVSRLWALLYSTRLRFYGRCIAHQCGRASCHMEGCRASSHGDACLQPGWRSVRSFFALVPQIARFVGVGFVSGTILRRCF